MFMCLLLLIVLPDSIIDIDGVMRAKQKEQKRRQSSFVDIEKLKENNIGDFGGTGNPVDQLSRSSSYSDKIVSHGGKGTQSEVPAELNPLNYNINEVVYEDEPLNPVESEDDEEEEDGVENLSIKQ